MVLSRFLPFSNWLLATSNLSVVSYRQCALSTESVRGGMGEDIYNKPKASQEKKLRGSDFYEETKRKNSF